MLCRVACLQENNQLHRISVEDSSLRKILLMKRDQVVMTMKTLFRKKKIMISIRKEKIKVQLVVPMES